MHSRDLVTDVSIQRMTLQLYAYLNVGGSSCSVGYTIAVNVDEFLVSKQKGVTEKSETALNKVGCTLSLLSSTILRRRIIVKRCSGLTSTVYMNGRER